MDEIRDTLMIGAGPTSLAAAIYTTREDIDTVVYEKSAIGGLAAITDKVDNYPGFPDGIEGLTLSSYLEKQAQRFGAHIEFGQIDAIKTDGDIKIVTVDGQDVKAKTVLVATGSDYKKIDVPGEKEYYGRGVHYCATCDGAFYRDKKLVVVGGGNSALQETIFLTRFVTHIDLLVRSSIKASDVLQKDLQKFIDEGKVTVHLNTATEEITAVDGKVTGARVNQAGETKQIDADGVFIFVGLVPNTQFLAGSGVELDEVGLVMTDERLQTNIPGIFAAGDVRHGATMQIASAVGEGATAALSIREYFDEQRRHA
jgi:thioredoxin reductase (NADPH)